MDLELGYMGLIIGLYRFIQDVYIYIYIWVHPIY